MNNWHDEYMAEFHRKDLLNYSEQIRLEQDDAQLRRLDDLNRQGTS
jgi:hypothetical protein